MPSNGADWIAIISSALVLLCAVATIASSIHFRHDACRHRPWLFRMLLTFVAATGGYHFCYMTGILAPALAPAILTVSRFVYAVLLFFSTLLFVIHGSRLCEAEDQPVAVAVLPSAPCGCSQQFTSLTQDFIRHDEETREMLVDLEQKLAAISDNIDRCRLEFQFKYTPHDSPA